MYHSDTKPAAPQDNPELVHLRSVLARRRPILPVEPEDLEAAIKERLKATANLSDVDLDSMAKGHAQALFADGAVMFFLDPCWAPRAEVA